ncbi:hypothetical protein Tco_1435960, partial [Tanacetum coccineum]
LSLGIQDKLEWRLRSGSIKPFAVSMVWQSIRPRDVKVAWVDVVCCPLCDSKPDSHEHLFFECPFSMQRTSNSVISKIVFAASAYFIWQEMNDHLFKNIQGWFGSHEELEAPGDIISLMSMFIRFCLCTVRWFFPIGVIGYVMIRALDTTTLRELIESEGRLIPEALEPGVPSVAILRPPRASMHDLYKRIGSMEIRQGAIERMSYREPITHLDMISSSMTIIISSTHLSSSTQMMMSSVEGVDWCVARCNMSSTLLVGFLGSYWFVVLFWNLAGGAERVEAGLLLLLTTASDFSMCDIVRVSLCSLRLCILSDIVPALVGAGVIFVRVSLHNNRFGSAWVWIGVLIY